MPDIKGQRSTKNVIASGDYKAADPTAIIVAKGAAEGLLVTLTPTALSGAGCTVTLTARDADTAAVLGTLVVTAQAPAVLALVVPAATHRVSLTPVGSGTRTTLTYSLDAVWAHLTYAHGVYWDGTRYESSEAINP